MAGEKSLKLEGLGENADKIADMMGAVLSKRDKQLSKQVIEEITMQILDAMKRKGL